MSGQGAYNVPQALRLSGPLDPAALDRALTQVIARHEALRTRLTAGPGDRPVQVIDPPRPGVGRPGGPVRPRGRDAARNCCAT